MEVGELVGKAGKAAEELGLDVRDILEDPDKAEQYARLTIAALLAAVAWHRADSIKYSIYRFKNWIDKKGGAKGEGMKWYDWLVMLTPLGFTIEGASYIVGQKGDLESDLAEYRKQIEAYQKNYNKWAADMAHLEKVLSEGTPGTTVYEMNLKVYNELKAKQPVRPRLPYYLDATIEDRIIYCSVAFMIGMHPELIPAMTAGFGQIMQGLGEITPL